MSASPEDYLVETVVDFDDKTHDLFRTLRNYECEVGEELHHGYDIDGNRYHFRGASGADRTAAVWECVKFDNTLNVATYGTDCIIEEVVDADHDWGFTEPSDGSAALLVVDPLANILHWWKLDEADGSLAYDSVGSANGLVLDRVAEPQRTFFDNEPVDCTLIDNPAYNGTDGIVIDSMCNGAEYDEFSWEMMFRQTAYNSNAILWAINTAGNYNTNTYGGSIDLGAYIHGSGGAGHFRMRWNEGGALKTTRDRPAAGGSAFVFRAHSGRDYHVLFSYKRNGEVRGWVNGQYISGEQETHTAGDVPLVIPHVSNNKHATIGRIRGGGDTAGYGMYASNLILRDRSYTEQEYYDHWVQSANLPPEGRGSWTPGVIAEDICQTGVNDESSNGNGQCRIYTADGTANTADPRAWAVFPYSLDGYTHFETHWSSDNLIHYVNLRIYEQPWGPAGGSYAVHMNMRDGNATNNVHVKDPEGNVTFTSTERLFIKSQRTYFVIRRLSEFEFGVYIRWNNAWKGNADPTTFDAPWFTFTTSTGKAYLVYDPTGSTNGSNGEINVPAIRFYTGPGNFALDTTSSGWGSLP